MKTILNVISMIWTAWSFYLAVIYIIDVVKKQFFRNEIFMKSILGIITIVIWIMIFAVKDYFT